MSLFLKNHNFIALKVNLGDICLKYMHYLDEVPMKFRSGSDEVPMKTKGKLRAERVECGAKNKR